MKPNPRLPPSADKLAQCYWPYDPEPTRIGDPTKDGEFVFAWWNTGVSPSGGGEGVNGLAVLDRIRQLSECCDVVGLGEFADQRALQAVEACVPGNREVRALEEMEGQKIKFNTAVIYNRDRFELDERVDPRRRNLFVANGAVIPGQYRIAQKARFKIREFDGLVDFYFSHWRMHDLSAGEPDYKEEAARLIQDDAFGRYSENLKNAAVVLMGDFNAEPHESHFKTLLMSRSSMFVASHGGLFNPFWRQLHDDRGTINAGNHKLRARYCLFDYIMVSAPFVNLPNFNCREWIACDLSYKPPTSEHRPIMVTLSWSLTGKERR